MRRTMVAATLALVACSDSSGPDPRERFAGTWDLVSIDAQALPFQMAAGPPVRVELTELTLDFPSATQAGVESRTFRSTPSGGGAPTTTTGTTVVNFEVDDDQVTIINTGSGLPNDVGTLDGDELTISRSVFGVYRLHLYRQRP